MSIWSRCSGRVPPSLDMVSLALAGQPLAHAADHTLGPMAAPRVLEILHGPGGGAMQQVAQTVDVFSSYGVIFLLFRMRQEPASMRCARSVPSRCESRF